MTCGNFNGCKTFSSKLGLITMRPWYHCCSIQITYPTTLLCPLRHWPPQGRPHHLVHSPLSITDSPKSLIPLNHRPISPHKCVPLCATSDSTDNPISDASLPITSLTVHTIPDTQINAAPLHSPSPPRLLTAPVIDPHGPLPSHCPSKALSTAGRHPPSDLRPRFQVPRRRSRLPARRLHIYTDERSRFLSGWAEPGASEPARVRAGLLRPGRPPRLCSGSNVAARALRSAPRVHGDALLRVPAVRYAEGLLHSQLC